MILMVSNYRGSPNLVIGKVTDEEIGSCEQLATMPTSVGFSILVLLASNGATIMDPN